MVSGRPTDVGDHPLTAQLRSRADGDEASDVLDLSQWRLNDLPDESSDEDWEDDREIFDPAGMLVEIWREAYPYRERMRRREYELEKRRLQIELLELQGWVRTSSGTPIR